MPEKSDIDREIRQQAAALRGAGMDVGDDDHGQMLYDAAERIEELWNGGNEMTDRYLKACEERNAALAKLERCRAHAVTVGTQSAQCMLCRGSWSLRRGAGELHEDWCPLKP